ncbi:hypothetical protein O3P69_015831 [Scylla paramamosain]|uniref:Uncharacterized protein n=1 Tax=Scylla paramamosain TaxID=85552 RepID=A0AAW0T8Q5_SCYPA
MVIDRPPPSPRAPPRPPPRCPAVRRPASLSTKISDPRPCPPPRSKAPCPPTPWPRSPTLPGVYRRRVVVVVVVVVAPVSVSWVRSESWQAGEAEQRPRPPFAECGLLTPPSSSAQDVTVKGRP